MDNEAKGTVEQTVGPGAQERPVASITIQPRDIRPFILRRWSATAEAGTWALEAPSNLPCYWRARSRRKLLSKALRDLRRRIKDPVVAVYEQSAAATERHEVAGAVRLESSRELDAVASGAPSG